MNKKVVNSSLLVFLIVLVSAGILYFAFFRDTIDQLVDDSPIINNPRDEDSQISEQDYQTIVTVEVVDFQPDPQYIGFRSCDATTSMCTVYGIKASEVSSTTSGEKYTLKFNNTIDNGIAAGTTYLLVEGGYELTPQ